MLLIRNLTRSLLLAAMFAVATTAVAADAMEPSGTVTIDETQFGLIIGGSKGGGVLTFEGAEHKFKIGGISLGTVGVSKVSAQGEVYELTDISKFEGTYTNFEANIALAGGVGGIHLKNKNGVI
ncbi:MAG: hypothetical protein WBM41_16555, partial [Arenicellales bacterium]